MKTPAELTEVLLQPGQWWFGGGATRLRTVLGSCVAVTLWHPEWRVGGMCHYMLPVDPSAAARASLDGRYGDEALAHLVRESTRDGSTPAEFEAKLFGGGRMFRTSERRRDDFELQVPSRNVRAGRELLQHHGFACSAEHVGGYGHREVILDLPSGHVWVRHSPLRAAELAVSGFGVLA